MLIINNLRKNEPASGLPTIIKQFLSLLNKFKLAASFSFRSKKTIFLAIILTFLLVNNSTLGASENRLRLIHADKLEQYVEDGKQVKKLTGNVAFKKGEMELECDLAYWYEEDEEVDFYHNIVITQNNQMLEADTLIYLIDRNLLMAKGKPILRDEERTLNAEILHYYSENEIAEAYQNVTLTDTSKNVSADYIKYFVEDKKAIALNNAIVNDTRNNTSLFSDSINYFYDTGNIEAYIEPLLIRYDSAGAENFRVSGDIIYVDENQGNFNSIGNVEIQQENFISYCDRANYIDSLEIAELIGSPRAKSDGQELSGEKMIVGFKNDNIYSLVIINNAIATEVSKAYLPFENPDSTEADSLGIVPKKSIKTYNEITGKMIEVYFDSGEVDSIRVAGMASSYYNVVEDSVIQGVNIATGDTIVMEFEDEDLALISAIGGTEGKFVPHETNNEIDTTIIYKSERIDYWLDEKVTELIENAFVEYQDISLTAGRIKVLWKENLLHATPLNPVSIDSSVIGLPTLTQVGQNPISGETMIYNIKTQKGKVVQGETKVEDGFFYGEDIKQTEREVFYASNGVYTTCDLPEPHYYFKSKKMKMIYKDKIIARPIILYIQDIPLIGLPFGMFPIKGGRRHSGWIMPSWGENKNVGGFIKGLGYFWAPNDYMDFRLTGDFFDKRGIILHYRTRYALRYKFTGSVEGSYTNEFFSDFPSREWNLNIHHNHTISPTARLNINGSFISNDSYFKEIGIDRDTRLKQQLISNATFSKNWEGAPYSMSVNLNQTHNLQATTKITIPPTAENQKISYINRALPNISFTRSQKPLIPLKPWQESSESKWYNNIYFSISSLLNNKQNIDYFSVMNEADSSLFWEKRDITKNAITHNISLNSPQKLFSVITLNESINLKEEWIFEYENPILSDSRTFIENEEGEILTETVHGFKARHTGSASLSAQTKLYGLFPIRIGPLEAIRHVLTPRIGLSYTPDFTNSIFGWDPGYVKYDVNGNVFDPFATTLIGYTPSREQKVMTFSVGNIFQAKTRRRGEEKKFDLFTLNISTGKNLAVDEFQWRPISANLRTQISKKLAINLSSVYDLYAYENAQRVDKWNSTWYGIPVPRLTSMSASTGFSMKGDKFGTFSSDEDISTDADLTDELSPLNEGSSSTSSRPESGGELWNANFNFRYSFSQSNPEVKPSETFWMSLNLSLRLTSKWKISYSASFDLLDKSIISQDFHVERDLHCWQLSFSWIPTGYGQQYYLLINIKSPILKDIKYEERGGRQRGFGY